MSTIIVLASENKKKIAELETLFQVNSSVDITVKTLREIGYNKPIAETGATFEENALIKANVAASLGYIGIADDSGLEVDALNGEPGVYSARYASIDGNDASDILNNAKLLFNLKSVSPDKRTARFVCAVACVFPCCGNISRTESFTVRGTVDGIILNEGRGNSGFGYDPLFYYPPLEKTFAELNSEEKNLISHRGKAMHLFLQKFSKYVGGTIC